MQRRPYGEPTPREGLAGSGDEGCLVRRKGNIMTRTSFDDTAGRESTAVDEKLPDAAPADGVVVRAGSVRECLADDTGATTAEYAITTLAACGFAALLVIVLKSDPLKDMITGVITTALGLGGGA